MRVLIIGGTGLISVGIVKHLLARGADITMFNRGRREHAVVPAGVHVLHGDRNEYDVFERRFASEFFDVVIDMIAFTPAQALSDVRAFGGRCTHFVFCSTVCTYGSKIPANVIVDESFPQEPISEYGRNKLACEQIIAGAARGGAFNHTIIRPSHTYGPGGALIDQLEGNAVTWSRVMDGQPVLIADGGLGLWNSTHRDDCGKLFAYGALNAATYGKSYNATIERIFTWRDYYREAGEALGRPTRIISMPADWLVAQAPQRFGLIAEITRFHGPYTSRAAMVDVPEFRCEIDFKTGVCETVADQRRRNALRTDEDGVYQRIVDAALAVGATVMDA